MPPSLLSLYCNGSIISLSSADPFSVSSAASFSVPSALFIEGNNNYNGIKNMHTRFVVMSIHKILFNITKSSITSPAIIKSIKYIHLNKKLAKHQCKNVFNHKHAFRREQTLWSTITHKWVSSIRHIQHNVRKVLEASFILTKKAKKKKEKTK